MRTMRPLLALLATVALGCAAAAPPPEAPAPPGPTPPTPTVAQPGPSSPPAPAASDVTRLHAGEWPGSNTHMFGARYYELRRVGGAVQLRLHDEIRFQGVGMTPAQMPPTRHACTAWEPLPQNLTPGLSLAERPAGDAQPCERQGGTCGALKSWLTSTAKPAAPPPPPGQLSPASADDSYGRPSGSCG